ncbi:MAG: hypothetical protein II694_12120, partial [Lachnospiraceae bacterium]|nr:hypothetical protein [Lachnospiraceae bacterium]
LLYLYKSEPSFVKEEGTVLSEKQANEYLKTYVSKQEWLGSFDKYEIKTVKANSFFFDNKDNGNIVLAFCFYNDNYLVYVNAYNGDIIGGDIFKTTRGGAIGTPDIYTSSQSISLAKNKLISLGYSDVIEMNSYYLVGATTYMKEAFYACCHGTSTVLSSIAGNNIPTQYQCSYTSVPTGTHKFVFLDACNTASTNWSTAFGITSGSIGKAFIGWAQSVPAGNTLDFCTYFWPLLNGYNSVWVAAIQACALEGSGLSLWFIGDQTYNGYY